MQARCVDADTWYELLVYHGGLNGGRLPSGLSELERLGLVETTEDQQLRTSPKLSPWVRYRKIHAKEFEILWSFSPEGHELVDGKIVKEGSGEEVQLIRYRGHVPGIADTCAHFSRCLFEKLRDIQRNQENVD